MSTRYSGFGAQIQLGDGAASESFTTVGGVQSISGPSFSYDTADLTAHDSSGRWEEIVKTIRRSGEITFDIWWDPADSTHDNTDGLLAELGSTSSANYKLIATDTANTTWTYPALCTGFSPALPIDGGLSASITLKGTGAPTLA